MLTSMTTATLWLLNILTDTSGQLAFKRAALQPIPTHATNLARWLRHARAPWIWIGMLCFVAEFVLWLGFLSLVPLSRGVLLGSINIVVVVLAGRWLFREGLSALRVAGILLIAGGVTIVGLGGVA